MRHRRLLATLTLAGALLAPPPRPARAQPATPPARATPTKAEQIQEAFSRARRLYRQSKYKAAIRAFEEVKDLQYHPILDYGIAKCHEALSDYKSAIYYLGKYVRNYPRFQMSARHPTVKDAQVKIGVLKEKQAAAALQGPGPVRAVTPPPAPGGVTAPPERHAVGEVVPGPYPFAPGAPVFSGVRPPGDVYVRRSIILFFGLGGGAFAREDAGTLGEFLSVHGGLSLGVLWRVNPYVAFGPTAFITGGVTSKTFTVADYPGDGETDGARTMHANIALEVRGIIPVNRVDIWASFGLGYTSISTDYDFSGEEKETTLPSVGIRGAVGLDIFARGGFTVGFVLSFIGTVPVQVCRTDEGCDKPADRHQPGMLWQLAMTFGWHLSTASMPAVKEPRP